MKHGNWREGDVVTLKSGGPSMTISGFHDSSNDSVQCMWFAGNDRKVDWFHPNTLKLVPDDAEDDDA